jgi:hypothetical protein
MTAPEKRMRARNCRGSYFDDDEDLILLLKQQMTAKAKYSSSLFKP